MVVPISGTPNFLPVERGKKGTRLEAEKVNFEDFLLPRIEPFDESAQTGDNKGGNAGQGKNQVSESELLAAPRAESKSQGGEADSSQTCRGRRIDLRA